VRVVGLKFARLAVGNDGCPNLRQLPISHACAPQKVLQTLTATEPFHRKQAMHATWAVVLSSQVMKINSCPELWEQRMRSRKDGEYRSVNHDPSDMRLPV